LLTGLFLGILLQNPAALGRGLIKAQPPLD
jgi:hypothetical protein